MIDHQTRLLELADDIDVAELRANTAMLAKLASMLRLPVITTASLAESPHGRLIPEIRQFATHAIHVPRQGEFSAGDNDVFVKTVRKTGRNTLIMAGI